MTCECATIAANDRADRPMTVGGDIFAKIAARDCADDRCRCSVAPAAYPFRDSNDRHDSCAGRDNCARRVSGNNYRHAADNGEVGLMVAIFIIALSFCNHPRCSPWRASAEAGSESVSVGQASASAASG